MVSEAGALSPGSHTAHPPQAISGRMLELRDQENFVIPGLHSLAPWAKPGDPDSQHANEGSGRTPQRASRQGTWRGMEPLLHKKLLLNL